MSVVNWIWNVIFRCHELDMLKSNCCPYDLGGEAWMDELWNCAVCFEMMPVDFEHVGCSDEQR